MKDSLHLTTCAAIYDDVATENSIKPNRPTRTEWEKWAGMDRTVAQNETAGVASLPQFDPIVIGPWLDLWTIEDHKDAKTNPHVDRYLETKSSNNRQRARTIDRTLMPNRYCFSIIPY